MNGGIRLGIFLNNGTVIGDTALRDREAKNRSCSLGIGFSKLEYRNKGYGSESVKLILEYAFHNYGLEKIAADTLDVKIAAQKLREETEFVLVRKNEKSGLFLEEKDTINFITGY